VKTIPQRYAGPTTLGVDTSRWQERDGDARTVDINYAALRRAGVRFAVVRTGDGTQTTRTSVPDPVGALYASAAADEGLLVAGYHFFRGSLDGAEQARIALEVERVSGVRFGFHAVDTEGAPSRIVAGVAARPATGAWRDVRQPKASDTGVTTPRVLEEIKAFVDTIEAAGRRAIVYGRVALHWYFSQIPIEAPWLYALPIWVPSYGSVPEVPCFPNGTAAWPPWSLWQYTGTGRIAGIAGDADLNRFRGDEAELARWWDPATRTTPAAPSPIEAAYADLLRHALGAKAVGDQDAAERLLAAAEGLGAKT